MGDVEAASAAVKRGLSSEDTTANVRLKRAKSDGKSDDVSRVKRTKEPRESPLLNGAPATTVTAKTKAVRKRTPAKRVKGAVSSADVPPLEVWTYTPGDLLPELSNHVGRQLQVLVPGRHLTSHNERVTGSQVWGTDVYTDDSDIVAVLAHTDKYTLQDTPPNHDVMVTLRILASADRYPSTNRKSIRSRTWAESHDGCSIKVEKVEKVKTKKSDDPKEKERLREKLLKQRMKAKSSAQERLRANRRDRGSPESLLAPSVVFSLSNDPCLKYTQPLVADRGVQPKSYTAYRFKNEVLYLETDSERYELALQKSDENGDWFKWSKVVNPKFMSIKHLSNVGVPLPEDKVEVMNEELKWTDIWWCYDAVFINQNKYRLQRAFWRAVTNPSVDVLDVADDGHAAASASA